MKKFLPLIVLSAFFFLPQSVYAGLSEGCFPIVQCDPGQDFYAGACKTHIETLTDCGVPPAGKYNAFTCDAGCYQMSYSVPGPAPICPGGIMVNGKCLIKLNVLDDMVDTYSVGNPGYKIWDNSKLTEVVHVGNAGCANNQIPVSDSTSPTGWKCGDGSNSGLWSTDGTNVWRPTGNVGVGTSSPSAKLDVEVASGGAATIGSSSNSATGSYAVAMGDSNSASGGRSMAFGFGNQAVGLDSFAAGFNTQAKGQSSTSFGSWSTANGSDSFAIGMNSVANGSGSFAATGATSDGGNSFAIGGTASGNNSVSMGIGTLASGVATVAMGANTTAEAYGSLVIGQYNVTNAAYNKTSGAWSDPVFVVGNGTSPLPSSRANALTVIRDGRVGIGTATPGAKLDVEGGGATIGRNTNTATGAYAVAMGEGVTANGNSSVAMGNGTTADGSHSVAMGYNTVASGLDAVAMGRSTTSKSNQSVAMGNGTTADGFYSVAMGYNTVATGTASVAMGNASKVTGSNSFAWGNAAEAPWGYSFVLGQYNVKTPVSWTSGWSASDPVFVIGNGSSATVRSNALTVLKSGNVGIGTASPTAMLDVNGTVRLRNGAGAGRILTSDANGNATWAVPTAGGDTDWVESGGNVYRSSGNVGIGTTTPDTPLHVMGNVKISNASIPAVYGTLLLNGATKDFSFGATSTDNTATTSLHTDGMARLFIANGGNVGIGTSTPTSKLSIYKDVADGAGVATDGIIFGNPAQTTGWAQAGIWAVGASGWNGSLVFGTDGDGVKNTNVTEKMRIDKDGRVGIGTSAPGAKLAVVSPPVGGVGAATIGSSSNVATGFFSVAMGDDSDASGSFSTAMGLGNTASGQSSTAMGQYSVAGGDISTAMGTFTNASGIGSTAMGSTTTASGEFATSMGLSTTASGAYSTAMGIGTVANVYGSVALGRYNYFSSTWSGTAWNGSQPILMVGNGINGARSSAFVVYQSGNAWFQKTLTVGEDLWVGGSATKPGGGSWANTSDARLKDVHGSYEKGLDAILHLKPVEFNYKADNPKQLPSDETYVGFIAQDVQPVFPEAISEDTSGYLDFDMHSINVAVINAIKELKAENDALKSVVCEIKPEAELCKK